MILSNIFNAVIPIPIAVNSFGGVNLEKAINLGLATVIVCCICLFLIGLYNFIKERRFTFVNGKYGWADTLSGACMMMCGVILFAGLVGLVSYLIS